MTYDILSDNEGLKVWKANDIKEELFAMAIKAFCKRIREVYSNDEIVILEHYYANEYVDNGVIFRYAPKRLLVGEVYETEPLIRKLYGLIRDIAWTRKYFCEFWNRRLWNIC